MKEIIDRAKYLCEWIDYAVKKINFDLNNSNSMQIIDVKYLETVREYLLKIKDENILKLATYDIKRDDNFDFDGEIKKINHTLKDILDENGILTMLRWSFEEGAQYHKHLSAINNVYIATLELQSSFNKYHSNIGGTPKKVTELSTPLNMNELIFKLDEIKKKEKKKQDLNMNGLFFYANYDDSADFERPSSNKNSP